MKTRPASFSLTALFALVLAGIATTQPVDAAPVAYPIVVTDTSGNRVTGATFAVNGTTLTPGTAATVTGKLLSNGSTLSSVSVTEYELSNGAYSLLYDAAANGEAYFPLTVTKSGSTITPIIDLVCSADSTNIVSANTNALAANTTGTTINTKLGTPAGASVSADVAAVKTSVGSPMQAGSTVALSSADETRLGYLLGPINTITGDPYAELAALLNGPKTAFTAPALANGPTSAGTSTPPFVHR